MLSFSYLLIICTLAYIALEDFKYQAVRWIAFPALFTFCIFTSALQLNNKQELLLFIGVNVVITFLEYGLLVLYTYVKENTVSVLNSKIGLGDLLFLFAISPLFHPVFFILFEIVSLLITLIAVVFFQKLNKPIPLAGYLSLVLITYIIFTIFSPTNLYHITVI